MKTLHAGAVYAFANIASAGVPFLLLPILTRALTPDEYGQVVSFFVLVSLCTALAGLGLHGAVGARWLNTRSGDPAAYTGTALSLVLVSTLIAAAAAVAFAPLAGVLLPATACVLAALLAGLTTVQGVRFAVWQSLGHPLPAASLQIGSATLNIGFSLVAVLALGLGADGRIGGAALAAALVATASIWLLVRDGAARLGSLIDARELLRFGLPLLPHGVAGAVLANADRLAVSHQFGNESLGIYGVAAQIGMVMTVLADAVVKAATPTLYRLLNDGTCRSRLRVVAITYLSAPLCAATALAIWVALLVAGHWIVGDAYVAALDLSVWFLLGNAVTATYLSVASVFFFSGKTEWISVASVSAAALATAIAPLAVSIAGLAGGGIAYLASQIALLALALAFSRRIRPMPWLHPSLAIKSLWRMRGRT